ncbi:MAG: DUF3307 domain-containing protein [Verrucomicrobiota bacterium]
MNSLMIMQFEMDPGAGSAAVVFLALVIGHVLADYPLQGRFLSMAKNRHADVSELFGGESPPRGLWLHALTAHSLVHAGMVWFITGSLTLGIVELILHWLIDFAKCEKWTNFTVDQLLHVACKAAYAVLIGYEIM